MKIQILVLAFAFVAVITAAPAAPAAPAKKSAPQDSDAADMKALDDAIAKNGPAIDKALKNVTLDDAMSDPDVADLVVSNMNSADEKEVAKSITSADVDEAVSNMDADDVAASDDDADSSDDDDDDDDDADSSDDADA